MHLTDVDEVMIVVVGVVEREELVGAGDVFSRGVTDLVYAHILIEEDLIGGMVVIEAWKIGRSMGNDVPVMDYSVDSVEGLAHVVGEFDVSNSGLPEVMNVDFSSREKSLEFQCADRRNSSTQTMSSGNNTRSRVLLQQRCYFPIELLFKKQIIHIETSMHLASRTPEIRYLLKVSILDPILSIAAASERQHDLVVSAVVAHVASCFGDWMLHVEGLEHGDGLAPAAGPGRYAVGPAEGEGCELGELLGVRDVVRGRRLAGYGVAEG